MSAATQAIDFSGATMKVFYTCVSLLCLKVLFMVLLIGRQRFAKKVAISPEDTALRRGVKVKYDDPDVERARRAHRNDLENILVFISVGFLYAGLKPSPLVAIPLFVTFTAARFFHTFVYAVMVKRQPSRLISFAVGLVITAYMAAYVALSLREFM